ncbi:MAG: adenylate/guanylate cyclase domain-containing protein [Alphaproteobacteria bacterium]|nr:adenylate/guanylate cyclase domain-containing protein [Alphaproteobacteria bacterium]
MHPEVFVRNFEWRTSDQAVTRIERDYSVRGSAMYLNSRVKLIHDSEAAYRRRLVGPAEDLEFPVLREFQADGHSDYLLLNLRHCGGAVNFISFLTDRPGGFSTAELALLHDLLPLLALRVELFSAQESTRTLLTTYLGREPARRVLAGAVRRNQVESIRAAVWFSDLRGFTLLSDRLPAAEVIALLDEYFELVGGLIEQRGGEVLKFLGDGVLGMFDASRD